MTEAPHPTGHAELSASSSERWMNCPGSINACRGLPDTSSVYADEGTAAHEVAATCLQQKLDAAEMIDRTIIVKNRETGEDQKFVVDEAMVDGVQLYLDTIREKYHPEQGDLLMVEERFNLADLGRPNMFGTSDAIVYKAKDELLDVNDFKYGAGVAVDADGNQQLRYYALGAALKLKNLRVRKVRITIIQPRASHPAGPVRFEEISAFDLLEWADVLLDKAKETEDPFAPLHAGAWCRFCKKAGTCEELRKHSALVAQSEFAADGELSVLPPDPATLTAEELARILTAGQLLTNWYRAVQAEAFNRFQAGDDIPGFKIVAKRAKRRWAVEDENKLVAALVAKGIPPAHIFLQKMKSPAQMEKSGSGLKPAQLKKLIADFWEKPPGAATLAPIGDTRPALGNLAAIDFAEPFAEESDE
jgi:hypothetical protein